MFVYLQINVFNIYDYNTLYCSKTARWKLAWNRVVASKPDEILLRKNAPKIMQYIVSSATI